MQKLSIIGPPILILIIGIAAYITVVKLTTPKPIVVNATPQSNLSTPSASITTSISTPSASQIELWQASASAAESWRRDPLEAAKNLSGPYGFSSNDAFSLVAGTTTVLAEHDDKMYDLAMYQPGQNGPMGIWLIQSIKAE